MEMGPRIGMQKEPPLPVPHQRPRAESFSSLQRTKIAITCLLSLASVEGKAPMNQFLVLACLALLHLAFASSARAASERSFDDERSFVGLWEGIDPVDGGDSLRSITCSKDQTCNLAVTDSVVTLCGGGTGFASGTGGLEGRELVFPNVVLTCPNGAAVHLAVSYQHDLLNRTLVETVLVVGGRTLPNIIFHKISR